MSMLSFTDPTTPDNGAGTQTTAVAKNTVIAIIPNVNPDNGSNSTVMTASTDGGEATYTAVETVAALALLMATD